MKTKSRVILLAVTALVFLTSCISRENFFELSNDTFDADINIVFPGGGSILSFGEIPKFTVEEQTVTVENKGDLELIISGMAIKGDSSNQFYLDNSQMSLVVEVGGKTTFKVKFQPVSEGDYYATVIIKSNDAEDDTYEIPIYGKSIDNLVNTGPIVSVRLKELTIPDSSGTIDFGEVETNTPSLPARFTLENSGDSPLMIVDISLNSTDPDDFILDDYETSFNLDALDKTTFDVIFRPLSIGLKSSTLIIESNVSTYTFTVTGTGSSTAVPDINVALDNDGVDLLSISGPETFDFGTVYDSKIQRFVIYNAGTGNLTINGVSSGDDTVFPIVSDFSGTIFAGDEAYFEISFEPGSVVSVPPPVLISIDTAGTDPDEDPYEFYVTGTKSSVPVQDITLKQTDLAYATIPGGSGVYDIGPVELSTLPAMVTFTVENTGGALLTVSDPVSGDPAVFAIDSSAFSSSIGTLSSQTFNVTFDTMDLGTKSALITIPSDDPDFDPEEFSFTVRGTVFSIDEPELDVFQGVTPVVKNESDDFDFGSVPAGGPGASLPFTITNTGTADLVFSFELKVDITEFSFDMPETQPVILTPDQSYNFNVYFEPSESDVKTKRATLLIKSNDSDENVFRIDFTGIGS